MPVIGIQEVASLLSVSPATVKNWLRLGKLRTVSRRARELEFDQAEVLRLKQEIESGTLSRLKSRRNKRTVSGNNVPTEYVQSRIYVELAEKILQFVKDVDGVVPVEVLLFEVALNLLYAKERIIPLVSDSEQSLMELVISGALRLGAYERLLRQLYDYSNRLLGEENRLLLRSLRKMQIPYIEGDDFLGLVYQSLSNMRMRKTSGSYYTPSGLVDSLVKKSLDYLEQNTVIEVLDPCCGSGNFLVRVFAALRASLLEQGMNLIDAEHMIHSKCIYGIDINPTAVVLTKINLALATRSQPEADADDFHIVCRNALLDEETSNGLHFDLVIGNPPWGYNFSVEESLALKQKYHSTSSAIESFGLFIEYGMSTLKERGILAFVLPEALLNVQLHAGIRKLVLDNMQLMNITLLGPQFSEVFSPTITLVGKKLPVPTVNDVLIETDSGQKEISQQRFLENDQFIINVRTSNAEDELLKQMKSLPGVSFLKNDADFALGIVTGNNHQYVLNHSEQGSEPVIIGNDVFKYNIFAGEHHLVFTPAKFQQVAPTALYRAPEKLFYRFINKYLLFAYDNHGRISLNSANIVIPRLAGHSIKYIMAVLNSRPAQFFHSLSFSSIKVLRSHIEAIPIPSCSFTTQQQIEGLVDGLQRSIDPVARLGLYLEIDERIADLFCLSLEQKALISKHFDQVKFLSKN